MSARWFPRKASLASALLILLLAPASVPAAPRPKNLLAELGEKHRRMLTRYKELMDRRNRLLNTLELLKYSRSVLSSDLKRWDSILRRVRRPPVILELFVSSEGSSYSLARRYKGRLNPSGTPVWFHLQFSPVDVRRNASYTVRLDILGSNDETRQLSTQSETRRVKTTLERFAVTIGRLNLASGRYPLRATLILDKSVVQRKITITITQAFLALQRRIFTRPLFPAPLPRPRRPSPLPKP